MTIAVPERVKIVMAILERAANAGAPCPPNIELAAAIGHHSMSSGAKIVSLLETMGMIRVERARASRVVTIVATGKSTAGAVRKGIKVVDRKPRKAPFWNDARDGTLMESMAQGLDFEQAAHWLGCGSEDAAVRFDQLCAEMGPQAV